MSDDLHFANPQLLSLSHVEIGAATPAQREQIVPLARPPAGAAAGTPRALDDVEPGARQLRALGAEVEAEADRVGHDPGELADLEHHPRHPSAAHALHDVGD